MQGELGCFRRRRFVHFGCSRHWPSLPGVYPSPARSPHQKHGLTRRNEAFGAVGPKGGTWLLEVEGTEHVAAEIAVLAARDFNLITTNLALLWQLLSFQACGLGAARMGRGTTMPSGKR